MATIGLKNLHYSRRTVTQSNGVVSAVTFATPVRIPGAISANVDVETADAVLDADDGTLYDLHPFKRGTITLNVDDLPATFLVQILGMRQVAASGIIVSAAEDQPSEVAIGFESAKANGSTRYIWYPRVKFKIPPEAYTTKGDSITFNTPTITGTIMEEVLAGSNGKHNWRQYIDSDSTNANASTTIAGWFTNGPSVL